MTLRLVITLTLIIVFMAIALYFIEQPNIERCINPNMSMTKICN